MELIGCDLNVEVAFPTFAICVLENRFVTLRSCWNNELNRHEWWTWMKDCGEDIETLHPMKISDERYRYEDGFELFNGNKEIL